MIESTHQFICTKCRRVQLLTGTYARVLDCLYCQNRAWFVRKSEADSCVNCSQTAATVDSLERRVFRIEKYLERRVFRMEKYLAKDLRVSDIKEEPSK